MTQQQNTSRKCDICIKPVAEGEYVTVAKGNLTDPTGPRYVICHDCDMAMVMQRLARH